jgi:predicted amidohydrolase
MSFEENQIFFIVFPEAFFNYFKHPNGIGDFIPSSFEEIKDFLEFSKKFKNIIFIPNIIYMDNLVKKNTFEKNFKTFGNHSYTQTKIIGLYDKYKDDEDIIPIFNETFVLFNGEILKSYKKQYILDQDIPIFTSENKSSYVIWDEKCMYIPGLENQINSTTLAIEICQDHYRLPIDQTPKSRMLIVQSATINLRSDLKNNYSGICIHADILKGSSSCLKIEAQKEKLITPKNIKFDIYNIKRYDIEY